MKTPVLPATEPQRLAALGVLDTPREARFERITRMAAALLNMPIALISRADSNRQWFISAYGEIEHFSQEKRYRRKDGAQIWLTRTGSLARDDNGAQQ